MNTSRQRSYSRLILLAIVPLLGACVPLASATEDDVAPRLTIDDIPGLGVSAEAVLRDDTIAYWEAWRRAEHTANCMREAGFTWEPEVLYPQPSIDAIASSLSIPVTLRPLAPSAAAANADAFEQLDPRQQDLYSHALYGESAEEMRDFSESGAAPIGRERSFAQGGCIGEARAAVSSVWDLRREVGPEVLAVELEIKRDGFDAVRADYGACAADLGLNDIDGPEDVDQLLAEATAIETAAQSREFEELLSVTGQVTSECGDIWARGSHEAYARAVSVVRERHPDLFDEHLENYAGLLNDISGDEAFTAHLSAVAGRSG